MNRRELLTGVGACMLAGPAVATVPAAELDFPMVYVGSGLMPPADSFMGPGDVYYDTKNERYWLCTDERWLGLRWWKRLRDNNGQLGEPFVKDGRLYGFRHNPTAQDERAFVWMRI